MRTVVAYERFVRKEPHHTSFLLALLPQFLRGYFFARGTLLQPSDSVLHKDVLVEVAVDTEDDRFDISNQVRTLVINHRLKVQCSNSRFKNLFLHGFSCGFHFRGAFLQVILEQSFNLLQR